MVMSALVLAVSASGSIVGLEEVCTSVRCLAPPPPAAWTWTFFLYATYTMCVCVCVCTCARVCVVRACVRACVRVSINKQGELMFVL